MKKYLPVTIIIPQGEKKSMMVVIPPRPYLRTVNCP